MLVTLQKNRKTKARDIIADEAVKAGLCPDDIYGKVRSREIVAVRHSAMRRAHAELGLSLNVLAKIFNRDPTTIGYAIAKGGCVMEGDYIAVIAQASALFAQGRMTEARGALLHAASMMEGHPERGRVLIWAEGLNATMKSRKVRAVMAEPASPIRLPLE